VASSRVRYTKKNDVIEIPNLIQIQRASYRWFLEDGLREAFEDISPINDYSGDMSLEFVDFRLEAEKAKYTINECKANGATYSAPMRVKVRLINNKTEEIKEQEIFMGDFPLMTENGTFIINGAERVIVSQLTRSPGVYYGMDRDKVGKQLINGTMIPLRGAWLEFETDSNDIFWVRIDRTRKLPITTFLRAMGLGTNEEIIDLFGEEKRILHSFEKDNATNHEEGLIEVYKKLRPGEPPTVESSKSLLYNMFFDPKRYDLAKTGRYKFNKKLSLEERIVGSQLAEDIVDPSTGEVVGKSGEIITIDIAKNIQNSGVKTVEITSDRLAELDRTMKIVSNIMVDLEYHVDINPEEVGVKEKVYYPALMELIEEADGDVEVLKSLIKENVHNLIPKSVTMEDIMASVNYIMHLRLYIGDFDNIDHLSNRRIRSVGELLQNQMRIGLSRMERVVRERMTTQDPETITPQSLVNIRPVTASIKEFFGSSQLSQFMDQTNPLSELAHKRRLSALGPGGLSRERAGFEVRDVNHTHYGRMCPIETPEGPNIGLINSLATYARVNEYGFLETPYRLVDQSGDKAIVTDEVVYFTADEEEKYVVAQANEPLNENGEFVNEKVTGRHGAQEGIIVTQDKVDLMDVSPKQLVSITTALIPFLENDDANRALMGSNMQRQAVPLLRPESPIIGTGVEAKVAKDSGVVAVADNDGTVDKVSANEITIKTKAGKDVYKLDKFIRTNQETCINQRPIVNKGDKVKAGDVIADGPSTQNAELALGSNPLMAFMTADGYNFEDAILLSERLVKEDVYTSIHIEVHEVESRDTKLGPEEITRDIPNVSEEALKNLDDRGIIRVGAEVKTGDILVGKVTPKGETELSAEEKLLRAIFGEKAREVRDTSKKVPHGDYGTVIDVKVFDKTNCDTLSTGVNQVVKVYMAQKKKIKVGDKMAGRHGNKGVVSRIVPAEDMPFMPNGRPVDIVLNPLGVPSRMNIGQVIEMHLGLASNVLNWKVANPVFEGASTEEINRTFELANDFANMDWKEFEKKWEDVLDDEIWAHLMENQGHREEWKGVPLNADGKVWLRDGRTGETFDNPITVGYMYYLKLHHLVDKKIHARSTGPYSLVTQQPLGGKAQFGGQRFGEMEVWALEGYGAAHVLQEVLTVKSDDVVGRVKAYEAIVKGENIPRPGIPESFKVLVKELQALGLDVEFHLDEKINDDEELKEEDQAFIEDLGINIVEADVDGSVLNYVNEDDLEG
jgi:DNA-directed RNA polymerase subunit beta